MINYPVRVVAEKDLIQIAEGDWEDGFAIKDSTNSWVGVGYHNIDEANTVANALNLVHDLPGSSLEELADYYRNVYLGDE